jgi:hypothetical protein
MFGSTPVSENRTSDGRFAPGHSGNPAGRPKGAKGLGRRLIEALREGEDEIILRQFIEMALLGDRTAVRFCAHRIDAAAAQHVEEEPPQAVAIAAGDVVTPHLVHAQLVQAALKGEITPQHALELVQLMAAKRELEPYSDDELTDEQYDWLAAADEEEDEDEDEDGDENENEDAENGQEEEAEAAPPDADRPLLDPPEGMGDPGSPRPPASAAACLPSPAVAAEGADGAAGEGQGEGERAERDHARGDGDARPARHPSPREAREGEGRYAC